MNSSQDRYEQGEGRFRADLEQGAREAVRRRRLRGVDAAKGESQRDEQPARGNEGDHEGNTGHQVLVRPGLGAGGFQRSAGNGGPALQLRLCEGPADCGLSVIDGAFGAGLVECFAREAGEFHRLVGGDDDEVRCGDFSRRQRCLRADGALRLHANLMPQGDCRLL